MVVEGPARSVTPDQPTVAEVQAARTWLARRGVAMDRLTRLLALRVGSRLQARRSYPVYGLLLGAVWGIVILPPVPAPARFVVVGAVYAAFPVLQWGRVRPRERAAARLVPAGARPSLRAAAAQVGWWYLASVVITFGGGAVLCAATFVSSPAAGAGWAAALALGAGSVALVLVPALRAPVIAEDETSLGVDAALRAQAALLFAQPAGFTLLAWIDFATTWPSVPPWFPLRVGYVVLAFATLAAAAFSFRRRYRHVPSSSDGTVAR
ncbi:hypothetical protein [Amycolatopsis sp. NPDC051061]|uniref:hypothetical protein n=1 Tax=Amycolatopsis sp. NPDC051061 TaxID=3155042 RepID=UPI003432A11F